MPSSQEDTRIVTLIAEEGARERAIGNIRATNVGEDDVTVTKVVLVDPVNVKLGKSVLISMTADAGTLGAGYPIPPASTDAEFERLNAIWEASSPLVGTPIAPAETANFVVGLEQIDKSKCASLESTRFEYTSGGKTFQVSWYSSYRFTKLDGTECPDPSSS